MYFIAFNFPSPIIKPEVYFNSPLQFFVAFWCLAFITGYTYPKLFSVTTRIRLPWWLYLVSMIINILIRYSIGLLVIEFLVVSLLTYFGVSHRHIPYNTIATGMIFSMVLLHIIMALIGNLCSAILALLFPRYLAAITSYGACVMALIEFGVAYWAIRRYQVAIMKYIEAARRHAPILLWTINIFWSTFFYFKFLGLYQVTHIPIPVYCLIAVGYLVSMFLVVRYLTRYFSYQELAMSQATEIKNLQVYTSHIEEMFDDLRRFRHDYKNILLSLGSAIQSGDLAATQKIYDRVVIPTNQTTESRTAVLGHLANIQDLEIKSLVYSKAMTAINEGLEVELEVAQPIKLSSQVKTLDTVRMISILLDNAINAAKETSNGKINFSLFAQDDGQHIVIGNSTKADRIPLQQLQGSFNGLTPTRHSLGLRTLQIILANYPFIQHNRSSNHHWVTQELIIH